MRSPQLLYHAAHSLAKSKGKARLLHGLCEILLWDGDVTDGECVLRDEALHRATAVVNFEGGAVLLVGARRRGIVLAVQEASDRTALRGRNPQVGATCVKNDLELLGRSTDFNLGEV